MRRSRLPAYGLILMLALILVAGCLTDPEKKETPTEETPEFRDLTAKDDVIYNLLLSYKEKDITEYSRLLLNDGDAYNGSPYQDSYYWYNQPNSGLDEYLTREEDSTCTSHIFLAAQEMPVKPIHPEIDRLILTITEGSWAPVAELFGQACEDCWFTEREYDIFLEMGETDIHGYDNVQFYIVPVDEGGLKIYKIAIAKDILAN